MRADEQAARLAGRAAAHAALDDPGAVARLLDRLREAGADEQAAALLARDPAAQSARIRSALGDAQFGVEYLGREGEVVQAAAPAAARD